jgi:hypothetical protein
MSPFAFENKREILIESKKFWKEVTAIFLHIIQHFSNKFEPLG